VTLAVTVENPADPDRPAGRGTGLGLRNVRARLHSVYGQDATLKTEDTGSRFVARLVLPLPGQGAGG